MTTTEKPGQAHYVHRECGGVTIWDLSGGFCTACHAEGLDADDIEPAGADPETPLSDAEHAIGQVIRVAGSWQMLGGRLDASHVAGVLLGICAPWTGMPDPGRPAADLVAVEAAAAVLERRYRGGRDERLDNVLDELRALARVWRRMAAEAGKRSDEEHRGH